MIDFGRDCEEIVACTHVVRSNDFAYQYRRCRALKKSVLIRQLKAERKGILGKFFEQIVRTRVEKEYCQRIFSENMSEKILGHILNMTESCFSGHFLF